MHAGRHTHRLNPYTRSPFIFTVNKSTALLFCPETNSVVHRKALGEITYLSFHKDAISAWGVMGVTNLMV